MSFDLSFFTDPTFLLLYVATILTSVISAMIGMAGGITLLSIMTFFFPYQMLIPIHGTTQLVSNITRSFFLRDRLNYKILIPFIIGAPLGAMLSTIFIKTAVDKNIPYIFIAMLIFYTVFKPKRVPDITLPDIGFLLIGFLSGVLGILIGATGPFLAPFLLAKKMKKEELVATKAAMQSVTHILKIPMFIYLGFNYYTYLPVIITMGILAIIGTKIGVRFLGKIDDKIFFYLFKGILLISAIRILYKVIAPYLN